FVDVTSTCDEEYEHVRKKLPDELPRADELHRNVHVLARTAFWIAFRRDDLGLQSIVDCETLRHPAELLRPGHVSRFMKEDVPAGRNEEHVKWDVDLKLRDTPE